MRVLTFIVKFTIALLLLSTVIFLIAREALLAIAGYEVKNALKALQLAAARGSYYQECQLRGYADFTDDAASLLQLRFLNETDYVLEAKCAQNTHDPVLISQHYLPPFVTKAQGGSGFSLGSVRSAVKLEVFRAQLEKLAGWATVNLDFLVRSKTVAAQQGDVVDTYQIEDYTAGPITSCTGYGYYCCDEVSQQGAGDRIVGLSGCEQRCFSSCVTRPVILSFTTSPFYDFKTRTLEVNRGDSVEFAYVVDAGAGTAVQGTIRYGDGAQDSISGQNGTTLHTFTCSIARCSYTVSISVTDSWGIDSAETQVSTLTVVVR